VPALGVYAHGTTYTIVTATGGVVGNYASVSDAFPLLVETLRYDANNVYLTLTFPGFGTVATTSNERSEARVLDAVAFNTGALTLSPGTSATSSIVALVATLQRLNASQVSQLLNALGGEPYADLGTVNIALSSAFMNTISAQMMATHGGLGGAQRVALAAACDMACDAIPSRYSVWLSGVGGVGSVQGDSDSGTLTYNFGGSAVGADYRFNPQFLVGASLGFAAGTQWVNGFGGQGNFDTVAGSLYASYTPGAFYVDGLAGYANSTEQLTRVIPIPGFTIATAHGQTVANQFYGQLGSGYKVGLSFAPMALTPFARLQGTTVNQAGLTENGANAINLLVAPQITNSLRSTFGADLSASLGHNQPIDVNVRLGWMHEYADTTRAMSAQFAGAPGLSFTDFAAQQPRDSAIVGLMARSRIAPATDLYARYDGQVGGGTDNHALTAGLRMTW
jgi:outer membrane autotransporter protein